jgi:HAD superfamily hydrolase (TIGR01509 family)
MIKLVIFDLDGVLVELKDAHYHALNKSLYEYGNDYTISIDDHYKFYDGLPTKQKLKLLTRYKKLPENIHQDISDKKQDHIIQYIYDNIEVNDNLEKTIQQLKSDGYRICVASNSIRNTIYAVLVKQRILHYVDHILSNQDVKNSKPNPEIYLKAFGHFGYKPSECLIIEDSPFGLEAAYESGSNVMKVKNTDDVIYDNIIKKIEKIENMKNVMKWDGSDFNIIIPMAGAGSRFQKAGYDLPKPLIDVNNIPMIQNIIENLNINANFIFVVQKEHDEKYNISMLLKSMVPNCEIVLTDGLTEGAACTTLLAKEYIDNDKHLILANSDQFLEWDSNRFYYQSIDDDMDGNIVIFKSNHPKWSYAKTNEDGVVVEVAEKNPISDLATVGVYFWKKGSDYVKYAEEMINDNIRTNNEFYVCPVYNQAIKDGKKIKTFEIDKMWGLGTPEDLEFFLKNYYL